MSENLPEDIQTIVDLIRTSGLANQKSFVTQAIEKNEINTEYLFKLSNSCIQNNRLEDAEIILDCLSLKASASVKIFYNLGLIRSLNGRHKEALDAYELVLKLNPNDVEALINMSSTYSDLKNYQGSLTTADRAIKISPHIPEAWVNRGAALCNLNLYEDSIQSYQEACRLNPLCFDAWLGLCLPLNKIGKHSDALIACDESIRLQVNSEMAHANRAATLNELNCYDEAICSFDRAISLKPNSAEYYFGKGVALHKLNKHAEALNYYSQAISIKADYGDAFYHKGLTLYEQKNYKEALFQISNAIKIDPKKSEYFYSKGAVLKELCQPNEASAYLKDAYALNPKDHSAQWANAFTYIPHIMHGDEDLEYLRNRFNSELKQLNEAISDQQLDNLHKVVGLYQPFYLAYQNFNNKNMLRDYGFVCNRFMHQWQLKNSINPASNGGSGKIKIGFVSSHIYDHSVWNAITKGLILNLDLDQFEVHIFYLGKVVDGETELAKSRSTSFISEKSSLYSWAKLISEASLDALIYPEIGMHQLTTQLASLRLCNIQMAAWGHPETTGLPNIDYYLSGELIEADKTDAYTEQLIKLPNLGSCYYKIPVVSLKLNAEIVSPDVAKPVLLCPGTPFKYDPKNDWIFIEIVKRLGACQLVFFDYREDLTRLLKFRLAEKFKAQNLSIDDFVVFSPWLDPRQFYELMQKSTVFLDTIGFSGFNTAIQAIECALPIATKRGEFMRGCLAGGLLKRIGLSELIANSDEEYIDLVIRLVRNQKYHDEIEAKIIKNRHLLYEDTSVVRFLENFLISQLRNN